MCFIKKVEEIFGRSMLFLKNCENIFMFVAKKTNDTTQVILAYLKGQICNPY